VVSCSQMEGEAERKTIATVAKPQMTVRQVRDPMSDGAAVKERA
jgi:hypothetical protein